MVLGDSVCYVVDCFGGDVVDCVDLFVVVFVWLGSGVGVVVVGVVDWVGVFVCFGVGFFDVVLVCG